MKEFVIFDVDNTMISGQSQMYLVFYLYKKGHLSLFRLIVLIFWFAFYKLGFVKNPRPAMEYGLSSIKGQSVYEVGKMLDLFFEEVLINKIYKNIVDVARDHKKNGRKIILLSNAPDAVIEKVSKYVGADDFISTKLEVIDGFYTGRILGDLVYGKEKAEVLKKYSQENQIDLSLFWAYADHDSDIYILNIVGHPHVVNPTEKLKSLANKNKWPILIGNI